MHAGRLKETREKLENLVRLVVEGRIIPFLGAGISNDAVHSSREDFRPSAEDMREHLAASIEARIRSSESQTFNFLDIGAGNRGGSGARPAKSLGLSHVAELHMHFFGQEQTYKAIRVEELAHLNPTDAHFYVAYLALEGCFSEIITTNWDCCLEEAISQADYEGRLPTVIRDLEEYECGGKPYEGVDSNHPVNTSIEAGGHLSNEDLLPLKIYKINGCIGKFRQSRKPGCRTSGRKHELVLTEAQLQSWRSNWAKDMFCDRLRSRTLLFSGFGSDEPQIRHTVLQVLREFEQDVRDSRYNRADRRREPKNVPIIAAHNRLSFPQYQILYSAGRALLGNSGNYKWDSPNFMTRIKTIRQMCRKYAFTAEDLPGLARVVPEVAHKCYGLDKNYFWAVVYVEVVRYLLRERYLSNNSSLCEYLKPRLRQPEFLLAECRNGLIPPGDRSPLLRKFVRESKSKPIAHRWHSAVLGRPQFSRARRAGTKDNSYPSFKNYPILLPLFHLVVWWLNSIGCQEPTIVSLNTENGESSSHQCTVVQTRYQTFTGWERPIYLVGPDHPLAQTETGISLEMGRTQLLIIVLTSSQKPQRSFLRLYDRNTILVCEALLIPESELFSEEMTKSRKITKQILDLPDVWVLTRRAHWRDWVEGGS